MATSRNCLLSILLLLQLSTTMMTAGTTENDYGINEGQRLDVQLHGHQGPPILSAMDFFLWGYTKAVVYETPVDSEEDLVGRIAAAAAEIRDTPGMLTNVSQSMMRRCEARIAVRESGIRSCSSLACNELGSTIESSLNPKISPCNDFYEFSCSGSNVNSRKEFSLKRVEKKLNNEITRLLQQRRKPNEPKAVQQAKDAFSACMNEDDRRLQGNEALKRTIEELGGWPILTAPTSGTVNETKWETVGGLLRRLGYSLFVRVNVNVDRQNPSRHIVVFDSMKPEIFPEMNQHMLVYLGMIAAQSTFIRQVVHLLGGSSEEVIKQDTKDMIRLQMQLNQISSQTHFPTNRPQTYNLMTVAELNNLTVKKMDWLNYLNTIFAGIKTFHLDDEIVVLNVNYVQKLGELLATKDARVLQNYLLWRLVRDVAEDGNPEMVALNQKVQGQQAQSRLDTCIKEIKGFMGFAVSNLYVTNNDRKRHLTKVQEVVTLVKEAFGELIDRNTWMDSVTKQRAHIKLKEMTDKLGYPEWILAPDKMDKHYAKLNLTRTGHFVNILQMSRAYSMDELELIKSPSDHDGWVISPLTVNAFYHRTLNDIYIPVAFMDRPFLDPDWPMAAVLGGIGTVIGHEITHGFDDESLLLTVNRTFSPWWTEVTTPRYTKAAECVTRQYDGYCPLTRASDIDDQEQCIDGKRTLRENAADIGGVAAAFKAYQLWKSKHGPEPLPTQLRAYQADQVFFMNFAQVWCEDTSTSALMMQMTQSLNSPSKYRLLGSLENMNEFGVAFNCTEFFGVNVDRPKCDIW